MSDWTSGYRTDMGYVHSYCPELNPLRITLAFLNAGLAPPKQEMCCELGFGQGVSVNMHAAASAAQWWGNDFNPNHAFFARQLAEASGSGAKLSDESFAEFCAREDLPDFTFIGLQGVWSWISNENRTVIVNFIRRKLKPGGVLYIGYNAMPGWAAFAPLRDLMVQHTEAITQSSRSMSDRIEAALKFAERLLSIDHAYARRNPHMVKCFNALKDMDRQYLAHELFNRDWHPMSFANLAKWLEPAKVRYVCSARYLDHLDSLNLTNEQQRFLQEIPDATFRESVRDMLVDQLFRCDYWVHGAQRLSPLERIEALHEIGFVLTVPRASVALTIKSNLGDIALAPQIYEPILDVLADHRPKKLSDIKATVSGQISQGQLIEALIVLSGIGHVCAAQEEAVVEESRARTSRLNRWIVERARSNDEINQLACPLIGAAIRASRLTQLFLLASSRGESTVEGMTRFVWQLYSAQGQRILKDGKTLESAKENLDEIKTQARMFIDAQLPTLKALGVGLAP